MIDQIKDHEKRANDFLILHLIVDWIVIKLVD